MISGMIRLSISVVMLVPKKQLILFSSPLRMLQIRERDPFSSSLVLNATLAISSER